MLFRCQRFCNRVYMDILSYLKHWAWKWALNGSNIVRFWRLVLYLNRSPRTYWHLELFLKIVSPRRAHDCYEVIHRMYFKLGELRVVVCVSDFQSDSWKIEGLAVQFSWSLHYFLRQVTLLHIVSLHPRVLMGTGNIHCTAECNPAMDKLPIQTHKMG